MTLEKKGKTHAIVAYITIFGLIIAMILNMEKQNPFATFHIRQAFGINLLFYVIGYFIISNFDSLMISTAFWIFIAILWFYGFIGALQEKYNKVPLLGEYFQKWFTFIK
ncbi:hypothetical protein OOZ15_17245 [Galbibacter sp. EGI 63066]|uniref:hypothetical protein n=1 Tax=Galbibacter sp. EGI 63066 TaxID=2993559 RepID=UPI0022493585|nr:hypothetical protein [Galbibacter sp. EGI 63066]MCX2681702.1 hypothetical protein [Galbibacter sp. EGI 63066]